MSKAFENSQSFVPNGGILMWSGTIATIPQGWFLCDGTNNTPDLRNKFIYGASTEDDVKTTGGSADAVVVEHDHNASFAGSYLGGHNHGIASYSSGIGAYGSHYSLGTLRHKVTQNVSAGRPSGSVSISQNGESGVDKNLPPYLKIAFIMKGAD